MPAELPSGAVVLPVEAAEVVAGIRIAYGCEAMTVAVSVPDESAARVPQMWNGRFAPSPTGDLHVGNLRTAVAAWLTARSQNARFVVRMEDLDSAVSRREHASNQLRDLERLGIDWDGPVEFQSDRVDLYESALRLLREKDLVYECFCSRREIQAASQAPNGPQLEGRYPGTCAALTGAERSAHLKAGRRAALRLRALVMEGTVTDLCCGVHTFPVDDLVLRRNDGMWAYNLAVVVDDAEQGVGTVVRADDLLPSTPRQSHLAALMDLPSVRYAHVPLVVNPSGQRLAKRDGAVTLSDLAAAGVDAAAVLGWMAWSLGLRSDASPVANVNELRPEFSLAVLSPTPSVFDPSAALWASDQPPW